jgi:hypothetical protein
VPRLALGYFSSPEVSEIEMSVVIAVVRRTFYRSHFLTPFFALLLCQTGAQTTVTISNTVKASGIDRPGINLGGLVNYGSSQLLKSLNYANGGYMPGTYFQSTYECSAGGSNTTTSWYNGATDSSGYPANFWVGASFVAINASTGTSYGSGTITASTANTGSSGITFTLSPAISSACTPSHTDVLLVRLTAQNTILSPNAFNSGICSGATWNTADTSPNSTNTIQSLEMPNGCSANFTIDAVVGNSTKYQSIIGGSFGFIH